MSLPVFLNVAGKRCLIVGGGKVGVRKARTLLDASAKVIILSPSLKDPINTAQHIPKPYSRDQLLEIAPWLVIAATNHEDLNRTICEDGQSAGILTESVSNTEQGDIRAMIAETRQGVTVTVSAGIPHFSRNLTRHFANQLSPELLTLLEWLRDIRPHTKTHIPHQPTRAEHWASVFEQSENLLKHLRTHNLAAARQILTDIFGEWVGDYLP